MAPGPDPLSAQAPARAPAGHRRAEFTVTLDGMVVTVPLTAHIGQASPPGPPPGSGMSGFAPGDRWMLWVGGGFLLLYVLALVLSHVH